MSSRHGRALAGILAFVVLSGFCWTQALAGSREVKLDRVTSFGGALVPPGAYTLVWKDNGDRTSVEVTIRSGKNALASVPGKRIQLARPATDDGIVYETDGNGTRSIARILFAARQEAIEVDTALDSTTDGAHEAR